MERLLTMKELVDLYVRYSRSHIMRLIDEGKFPKPMRLGNARIAWPISVIEAWQQSRT